MSHLHNKSVTLLELLIAISLLSLIAIGFSSIEIFSKYQATSADRRAKLQNEAAFALEHMTRQITLAIGNANDWPVRRYADGNGIRIRVDNNPANGRIDATDRWIAYRQVNVGADSEIRFFPNAGNTEVPAEPLGFRAESIARYVQRPPPNGLIFLGKFVGNELQDSVVEAAVLVLWRPAEAVSVDNPIVNMGTRIKMPSVSTR